MPCAVSAATVTVTTAAQLDAALKAASGGDIIKVAPGNYGDFDIRAINPASAVTIVAANSSRPPVFTHLAIRDSSQLRFTRMTVNSPAPIDGNTALTTTEVYRSHDIRLSSMVFGGVPGGGVANEPRGLRLTQSSTITVAGSSFSQLSHGIVADGSSRLTITDNAFSGMRTDGIIADGAGNSVISRNRFSSFRPEAGDHPDAIQIFNNFTPTYTLTVSDNLMIGDAEGQMQGIFMTNSTGDRTQLDRITIAGNLMWGTMWNGIAAFDAKRVTVTGNTLYSNQALAATKTWVRLENVTTAEVTGNVAGAYLYDGIGSLIDNTNLLSLESVSALAAVALWDSTHSASGVSVPYTNIGTSLEDGGLEFGTLSSIAAVPEPASWLSMITGFGILGFARRRLQPKRARRIQPA
jgi:parallel beta-helix repeat protein